MGVGTGVAAVSDVGEGAGTSGCENPESFSATQRSTVSRSARPWSASLLFTATSTASSAEVRYPWAANPSNQIFHSGLQSPAPVGAALQDCLRIPVEGGHVPHLVPPVERKGERWVYRQIYHGIDLEKPKIGIKSHSKRQRAGGQGQGERAAANGADGDILPGYIVVGPPSFGPGPPPQSSNRAAGAGPWPGAGRSLSSVS